MANEKSNNIALIQAVQKYDVLYNRQNPKYKDNFHRQSIWQLIASELDCFADGKSANARWKQLRQAYTRSKRRSCNAAGITSRSNFNGNNGLDGGGEDCSSSDDFMNEKWANMRWMDPYLEDGEDGFNGGQGSSTNFGYAENDDDIMVGDFSRNGAAKLEFSSLNGYENNDNHNDTNNVNVTAASTTSFNGDGLVLNGMNGNGASKKRKLNGCSNNNNNNNSHTNNNNNNNASNDVHYDAGLADYDDNFQKQLLDVVASFTNGHNGGNGFAANGANGMSNGYATLNGGANNQPAGEDEAYGRYIGEKMKRLTPQQRVQARMKIENLFYEIEYGAKAD